jgi:hypothetical protein
MGLMVGTFYMDIYGEATASPEGYIEVDFLTGSTYGGRVTRSLEDAIKLYQGELPNLCVSHRVDVSAFRKLTVRCSGRGLWQRFVVTIEDQQGHSSVDEYQGIPGTRVKVRDHMGRLRPKRHPAPAQR